jgi:hypothetical protein
VILSVIPGREQRQPHAQTYPESLTQNAADKIGPSLEFVVPGLVPGIHVVSDFDQERRGWPE